MYKTQISYSSPAGHMLLQDIQFTMYQLSKYSAAARNIYGIARNSDSEEDAETENDEDNAWSPISLQDCTALDSLP